MTAIQSLYSRQTFDYDLNDRLIKETQNGHRIERTYDDEAQTLTRTLYIEGKDEWKFETNYAIVQPNGKVLGLLAPNGKLRWRAQNKSLWGLTFSDYNRNSPLDPNLLFAGQYYDEESGLTYNRFRYYDPETACYLNSDPIGLEGGSTPYFYVQNPLDWVDLFGLAGCKPKISVEQYQAYKKLRNLGFSAKEATKYSKGFDSFSQFKRVVGPAGKGQAWHHIIEQTPSNIAKFGANKIHNINNLIKLPHGKGTIHAQISGFYSSIRRGTSMRVRDWLKNKNFNEQYQYGIKALERFGWKF